MRRAIIAAGAIWIVAGAALAAPAANDPKPPDPNSQVEILKAKGFVVVKEAKVMGDFDGCDYGRQVTLIGGNVFTCSGFGYMHAASPKAVVLKSKDGHQFRLVVQNTVFDGDFS